MQSLRSTHVFAKSAKFAVSIQPHLAIQRFANMLPFGPARSPHAACESDTDAALATRPDASPELVFLSLIARPRVVENLLRDVVKSSPNACNRSPAWVSARKNRVLGEDMRVRQTSFERWFYQVHRALAR